MLLNEIHSNELKASIIRLRGRVELYEGSTLTSICHCGDSLQEFTVERTGENKFYGFGICQKLHGILINHYQKINVTNKHSVEVAFGVGTDFVYPYPKFYVQEYKSNEEDGTIEFTAYDRLFKAENYILNDLALQDVYSIKALTAACANILELPLRFVNIDDETLDVIFTKGVDANLTGEESVRRVMDAIAEFTQSIYFINKDWELVFKRLNPAEELALAINRRQYISFENSGERKLNNIISVTEGEDNTNSIGEGEGVTQFIRDNPFYTLRNDLDVLLARAQANVGGMTLAQFNVEWSGNYLLEIGDRISLEGKNTTIYSYLLDDSITFDGSLYQKTSWSFDNNEGERASNPITLGEALNQTYIRVDKANKRIDMLVSESDINRDAMAAITVDVNSISQSVTEVQKNVENKFEGIDGELVNITNKVETMVTSEAFEIGINNVIDNGVKKVETRQGFVFDKEGLTIEKSNSEIKTQITENGMKVYRSGEEVLTADNEGVKAEDLHATTYLIIGSNSRFEDYGSGRTACFWIGS